MTYIGIDPGISGAVAFIAGERAEVMSIPTIQTRKNRKVRNDYAVGECVKTIVRRIQFAGNEPIAQMWMEQAWPRPENGATTAFKSGVGVGVWRGIAGALNLPLRIVSPQKWKGALGLLKQDKEASRLLARKFYPQLGVDLKYKCDHNKAEALLIARYGWLCRDD